MSRVFGKFVATRARLYETGVLPVHRLQHPVISVGNLTVGGTGKTPLVIELARQFKQIGYRPVILSRGYRRSGHGILIVSRGKGPDVDWKQSGDEPQLMAIRLPDVAVVVGGNRYRAGRHAETERLGNLFILDDGFQYRRLHRDVDIVTIDPIEWAGDDRLLPEGRWREPRNAIQRAHAACIQVVRGADTTTGLGLPKFEVETVVDGVSRNGQILPVSELTGKPVTAFAGIAKPERFFDLLEFLGITLARKIAFRDHHRFTASDLRKLPGHIHVTTEKDAIRLPRGDFYFLRISVKIKRFNELHDLIRQRIELIDDAP